MTRTALLRTIALVLMVAMLGAACGSDSDGAETTVAADGDGAAPAAPADESETAPAAESGDDGEPEDDPEQAPPAPVDDSDAPPLAQSSPIGEYLGGDVQAALVQYQIEVEEKLVLCMAQQGFEFKRSAPEVSELDLAANELTEAEWTARYGFGISTSFDSVLNNQMSNPNAEILFSLGQNERDLWLETLTGSTELGGAQVAGDDAPPLEEQGCIGQAIIETGGDDVIAGLEEFGSEYEERLEGINDTPEMVNAVDAWVRCMSEGGFPGYTALDSPEDEIGSAFDTLTRPLTAALSEIDPEDARALIEDEALEIEALPDFDVDGLRELQARELELAAADLGCYDANVRDVYTPLRDALERGLIDQYQSELDGLKNLGS